MNDYKSSPQFRDGKFRNTVEWKEPSVSEFASTFRKFIFHHDQRTPEMALPAKKVEMSHFNNRDDNQLNVTWPGHSSLMINIDGFKILTDPVFEKRISFFGPTRFKGELPLDISQLPEIDLVLISHNHYDHLNQFSIRHLAPKTRQFIAPLAVGELLRKWGVASDRIIEMDWWQEHQINSKVQITATPSQHFSGRGLGDRYQTLWVSYVIKSPNHTLFFGGDSGYFDGFRQIGEKYGPFDMTFLECGAYNERWHHIHMYPEETVRAHLDLGGKILHPIHWATFNLSLHPWYEPMERFTQAAASEGIRIAIPVLGETTVFDNYIPTEKWWKSFIHKN